MVRFKSGGNIANELFELGKICSIRKTDRKSLIFTFKVRKVEEVSHEMRSSTL